MTAGLLRVKSEVIILINLLTLTNNQEETKMNSIIKKLVAGTAVLALSTTVFASASLAADSSTTILGGTVGISPVETGQFNGITLNGTTQKVQAQINTFDITDARGTGEGWNVTVSASPFTSLKNTLDANALNLTAPIVSKIDLGSSELSTITASPGIIDNGIAPVKVLSAAADGGMGSFRVATIPMELTLKPHEVYAGTYTSTITATLTTGPGI
jgi:hypothetical protein